MLSLLNRLNVLLSVALEALACADLLGRALVGIDSDDRRGAKS